MPVDRKKFNPLVYINDLPDELRQELKLSSNVESKILQVLEQGGGTLNISEMLVGYYKVFEEIKKRSYMASPLYRMRQKGLIYPTGKKGEYTLNANEAKGKNGKLSD